MTTSLIRFTNIVIAALLAGTSFGIWVGLNPSNYSPTTYIEQQNQLVLSLNTLMVTLVIIATLVTVVSAYLQRRNRIVFITLLFAAVSFASCILISRFGNLPIQKEMLTWNANSLPGNWTMMRDQWWSFHILRTVAELVALALVAWASIQKGDE
jgi:Na+/H+-dicarboxylate symporter